MDRGFVRLIGLAIIWSAFAIVSTTAAIAMSDDGFWLLALIAITTFAAIAATAILFEPWQHERFSHSRSAEQSEKAKRRTRVERLLDELNADEMEQLRTQLGNDGEWVTLEDLGQRGH